MRNSKLRPIQKIASLYLRDNIYHWIPYYFGQRGHVTNNSLRDTISAIASIVNASIIQGYVLGPSSYVVASFDLHEKFPKKSMMK